MCNFWVHVEVMSVAGGKPSESEFELIVTPEGRGIARLVGGGEVGLSSDCAELLYRLDDPTASTDPRTLCRALYGGDGEAELSRLHRRVFRTNASLKKISNLQSRIITCPGSRRKGDERGEEHYVRAGTWRIRLPDSGLPERWAERKAERSLPPRR